MTSPEARKSAAPALDFSATKAAVWLSVTAFLALLVLYFVGMDQGAMPALDLSPPRPPCGCPCTAFFALLVLYFVGIDQGATSVFGSNTSSTSSCTTPATYSASPATDRRGAVDTMEKQIIGRGLLAGALAGVFAFVFARIFVEPVIERAIGYEDGVGAATRRSKPHTAATSTVPKAVRSVHPRRAGQHRHGLRGAGVQRRDGRAVRGGVRGGLRPGRQCSARLLSVYVAGGMLLSL